MGFDQLHGEWDLTDFIARQKQWSLKTFGPGERSAGCIDHIRKELIEIEEAPLDLKEWVDVITLALDAAWRAGHSPADIAAQLDATLDRNIARKWPDWRTQPLDKAIEHVRE
jgi:hypothetical protein